MGRVSRSSGSAIDGADGRRRLVSLVRALLGSAVLVATHICVSRCTSMPPHAGCLTTAATRVRLARGHGASVGDDVPCKAMRVSAVVRERLDRPHSGDRAEVTVDDLVEFVGTSCDYFDEQVD